MKPNEMSAPRWAAKLGAHIRHGASEDDPRVIECRSALAYWRAQSALGPDVVAALSDVGRDLLMAILRGEQEVTA